MNYRSHAFLALLSHAANEGVRTGCFDPKGPNGNPNDPRPTTLFSANLGGAVPMRVFIADWRFDEARIVVAAWPTAQVDRWIEASGAKALAGDVVASGWLERHSHLLLVNALDPAVFIRHDRMATVRALSVPSEDADPLGLYPRQLRYAAAA